MQPFFQIGVAVTVIITRRVSWYSKRACSLSKGRPTTIAIATSGGCNAINDLTGLVGNVTSYTCVQTVFFRWAEAGIGQNRRLSLA